MNREERIAFGAGVAASVAASMFVAALQAALPSADLRGTYIFMSLAFAFLWAAARAMTQQLRLGILESLVILCGSVALLSAVLVGLVDGGAIIAGLPIDGGNFLSGILLLIVSVVLGIMLWQMRDSESKA